MRGRCESGRRSDPAGVEPAVDPKLPGGVLKQVLWLARSRRNPIRRSEKRGERTEQAIYKMQV